MADVEPSKSEPEGYRLYLYVRKVGDDWLANIQLTIGVIATYANYAGKTRNQATKRAMDWAKEQVK